MTTLAFVRSSCSARRTRIPFALYTSIISWNAGLMIFCLAALKSANYFLRHFAAERLRTPACLCAFAACPGCRSVAFLFLGSCIHRTSDESGGQIRLFFLLLPAVSLRFALP